MEALVITPRSALHSSALHNTGRNSLMDNEFAAQDSVCVCVCVSQWLGLSRPGYSLLLSLPPKSQSQLHKYLSAVCKQCGHNPRELNKASGAGLSAVRTFTTFKTAVKQWTSNRHTSLLRPFINVKTKILFIPYYPLFRYQMIIYSNW